MKFIKYLKESYRLLIFYFALMIFMLAMIYVDNNNNYLNADMLYMTLISFFMFIAYLIWDYNVKYGYIKKLIEYKTSVDKTPIFPKPIEYKDNVYSNVISDVYDAYILSLKNIEGKVTENNEFMTAWIHEIKTPITTLKLLTETMKSEEHNQELVVSLKEEIDKIDDYVEKVLYYSRSDSFSKDYIISEVTLNDVIKESVKKHSIIFIRKHISFINNVDKEMFIDTDRKWLLFIIDQLISNALKYTKEKGNIKVTSSENEKEKILIVQDDGIGIKKEDIERIFTKSFTGNNGREINSKSTGMGLYLSQKLARKLGHYITLESEYREGTSVFVHFPKWSD